MGHLVNRNKSEATAPRRCFLFLQGHPSFFARNLANQLEQSGHRVRKINFCTGDALYWYGRKATSYRGRFSKWREFLIDYIKAEGITDILYYGDRRPYHRVAADVARDMGLDNYAYEFGYLRPDWITIERNGLSAFSHFPRCPDAIEKIAAQFDVPDDKGRLGFTKSTELFHEVAYNLSSYLFPVPFPFYKADRYYNLLLEYVSGIPGLFLESRNQRRAQRVIDGISRAREPFFLFPLQLQSDYQLRSNAAFAHQSDAIDLAMRSFAEHAPADTKLIFKSHPLDNGWERWPRVVRNKARAYGIAERVHFISGGNLERILKNARGCVLINSTVGLHALLLGCPVKVLGSALFDIKGLCDDGPLNDFWSAPLAPDPKLTTSLVKALAGTIQVRGNFFTKKGQAAAIPKIAEMLLENRINGAGAFVDPPPRLAELRAAELRMRVEPVAQPGQAKLYGVGYSKAARLAHFLQGVYQIFGFAKAER